MSDKSREQKMPCGCYAEPYGRGKGWIITASAFTCPTRHAQGDLTYAEPSVKSAAHLDAASEPREAGK